MSKFRLQYWYTHTYPEVLYNITDNLSHQKAYTGNDWDKCNDEGTMEQYLDESDCNKLMEYYE